ncbi:MAG: hypothetical protein EOO02_22385, partial [Chitinophagaceae bacterium]
KFFKYVQTSPEGILFSVFLRTGDAELAARLLAPLSKYLSYYQSWIGQYPYSQFSVIENIAETGWGLPGFTLLGPSVLRLPFLLETSLPHELLHNWWGNGVKDSLPSILEYLRAKQA